MDPANEIRRGAKLLKSLGEMVDDTRVTDSRILLENYTLTGAVLLGEVCHTNKHVP